MKEIFNTINIYDFFTVVIQQAEMIIPFWLLGISLGSFIIISNNKWITGITSILGKEQRPWLKIFIAASLGALSPITLHGVNPIIAVLDENKIPEYILGAFIVTSILINPNVLVFSMVLGKGVVLLRLLICVFAGVIAGILIKLFCKHKKILRTEGFIYESRGRFSNQSTIRHFWLNFQKGIRRTGPNLLLGLILTGIFDKYFPREVFNFIFVNNKALAVLFSASIGVPVYYCGGGTIPLINAWMGRGMGLGSVIAFMTSGPATKINNLTAVKNIVNVKGFAIYLVYTLGFSIISGLLIEAFI